MNSLPESSPRRRQTCGWTSALLALLGIAACSDGSAPAGAGKNLLLITLDTTRADHLSCLGGEPGNTPRIDALAARSTLFTYAASESNVTPTRKRSH